MNDSPPPSSNWGFGILLVSLLIGSLVVATVSTLQVFQLRRENQALRFAQFQQQSQRQFVGRGALAPGLTPDSFEVQRLREENMELQRMRSEVMQMREQLRQRDTVRPTTTTTRQTGGNAGRNNGGFRSGTGTSFAKNDLPGFTKVLSDKEAWKGVPKDRFERRKTYLE